MEYTYLNWSRTYLKKNLPLWNFLLLWYAPYYCNIQLLQIEQLKITNLLLGHKKSGMRFTWASWCPKQHLCPRYVYLFIKEHYSLSCDKLQNSVLHPPVLYNWSLSWWRNSGTHMDSNKLGHVYLIIGYIRSGCYTKT